MLRILIEVLGMLLLSIFFLWKKPQKKLLLFAIGFFSFSMILCIDASKAMYLLSGSDIRSFFFILSPLIFLPLPSLLNKSRLGKVVWPIITVLILIKLLYEPCLFLFLDPSDFPAEEKPAELSKLDTLGNRRANLLVIKQSTAYSCTPACLSSLLTDFGHKTSEREAAILLGTTTFGSSHKRAFECLKQQFSDLEVQIFSWEEVDLINPWVNLVTTNLITPADQVYHSVLVYPCPKGSVVKIKVSDLSTGEVKIVDYRCEENMLAVGDPRTSHSQLFTKKQFVDYYKIEANWMVIQIRKKADQSIPQIFQNQKLPLVLFRELIKKETR